MQITSGIRAILSSSYVYSSFQNLMGAQTGRRILVKNHLRPYQGMKVLDIGCGPADILEHLPEVDYWGFDISEPYIRHASRRYSGRGHFECKTLSLLALKGLPKFDLVLGVGLLHHLDDPTAKELIELAATALKPQGRLITIDGCLDVTQSRLSRLLVSYDRGQHIRTVKEYVNLVEGVFPNNIVTLQHRKWIPYTHCIIECSKD